MHEFKPASFVALLVLVLGAAACDDEEEYEVCDLAAPECDEGRLCRRTGDGTARCVPNCASGEDCPDGYICHHSGDGSGACVEPCDPDAEAPCSEGLVCELYDDNAYMCSEALVIAGMVFDLSDLAAIEGAHVVAANSAGFAVSDVAVTDAEGAYSLTAPSKRNADGVPTEIFTLRVAAQDYLPYPYGIRPSLPVDSADAVEGDEGGYVLDTAVTDVGLIPLPADQQSRGSISGTVTAEGATGTLVVAEGGEVPAPFGYADTSGVYTIFNVPDGTYEVRGYQQGLQLQPAAATVSAGAAVTGVDLAAAEAPLSTVTGSVNIVNAPGGAVTSVVLVPESTFMETFARGEVPPGLRAPEPGLAPNVSGAFEITGVPDGAYVVLAAFENDDLVRDPDPSIAGTQIVHMTLPGEAQTVAIPESFKVTEALVIQSPGAEAPEPVTGNPTFVWMDDSSETYYGLVVYNAFGETVWEVPDVPRVTGNDTVEVDYAGPALEAGMYYQFRATSFRDTGPISQTEDLRGVFFVPAE